LAITSETPDFDKFMAMLVMPNVVLETLVDSERTPKNWIDHHAGLPLRFTQRTSRSISVEAWLSAGTGTRTSASTQLPTDG
jgi:hypothetical protein